MRHVDEASERGVSATASSVPYGYERIEETVEPAESANPGSWPEPEEGELYRVTVRRDHLGRERHRVVLFVHGIEAYEAVVGREWRCKQTELVSVRRVEEGAAVRELARFERHEQTSYTDVVRWLRAAGRTGKPVPTGADGVDVTAPTRR